MKKSSMKRARLKRARMKRIRILVLTVFLFCCIASLTFFYNKFSDYSNAPNRKEELIVSDENNKVEEILDENLIINEEEVVKQGYEIIDQFLSEEYTNKRFQGVALVAKGDDIQFAKAYGYADLDDNIENTVNTRFAIASNTKQFTATAIMQLVEDGKVKLDQTIDKYFPEYQYGSKITVKDLLQMRSGIPCYLNEIDLFMKDPDTLKMLKEYEGGKYFDAYVQDERWTPELILENLYLTDLIFEPGTQYDYCNTNYYLLGLIIEQASGMKYEDYIEKNIFKPCGMTTSNMKANKSDAKGYGSKESGEIIANPKFTYAAGNIYANVYDLFRWNRALHKGNLISEKSYKEMITPVDNYGYGLFIKEGIISHSGVIDGFNSNTIYDPVSDVTVIVMENIDPTTDILDAKYDSAIIKELIDKSEVQ